MNDTTLYRKSSQGRRATINSDGVTARVFAAIDGNNSLSVVAEFAGVSIPVLWQTIAKLKKLGLIEEGAGSAHLMGTEFAIKVQRELTKAVGPVSNVLIQNAVQLMKFSWPRVPAVHAREFIYRLLVHIPHAGTREAFKITMLKEL
jgi:hypothetical protein